MVLFERCLIACALYEEFWIKVTGVGNVFLDRASSLHFPIHDDNHIETNVLHSLRVTLICDCICCIRGWPACHTRFDCSICQLLRCIFFVSHYLTETYLIGSMKVLMGLHRKFLKTDLVNEEFHCFCRSEKPWFKMPCLFFPFSSFLYFLCPVLHFFHLAFSFSTLKYAKYLEGYSIDGMRHIYKKACITHLPKKPAIHLLWAAFEEQQGERELILGKLEFLRS